MTTIDPLTGRTPREELYRAIVTGGTLIRQPGQDHTQAADARLDAYRDQVLAEVAARVEQLPTANQGQLIAATREQILIAITRTVQEG